MLNRKIAFLALSLVIASTAGILTPAQAEEMVIESDKTYTRGTNNGKPGYWVEFARKRFVRNQMFIANPIGRYDATIQEAFAQILGLNRALNESELAAVYSRYGIPRATSANYDGAAYHDFNFNTTLARIKADLTSGSLTATKASAADVALAGKLMAADNTQQLVDLIGPTALNGGIVKAFQNNIGGNMATSYNGGEYIYTMSDGAHSLSYSHGVNYINSAEYDAATYSQYANGSVQNLLLNNPTAFKKLAGVGIVDSLAQAGRYTMLADLVDKGINPVGLKIDTWVDTVNGPVHVIESQPTAARLREISRWMVASSWTTHSPVALDLNHDGKIGVTGTSTAQKRLKENKFVANGAVWFDITAEGKKRNIEWLNADGDGFLVDDTNGRVSKAAAGDGMISAHALFGDAIGYANGYHKLAYKATQINLASVLKMNDNVTWSKLYNKNAALKGKTLDSLKVWVDSNRDATVQPKELYTLASLGITELGSKPSILKNQHGEYVIQSYFVQNGKRHMTEDVWFAENPETQAK